MVCFVTDQCSKPSEFIKNHYEWPPNCTSNERACEYLVEWELKEGDRYVKFTIWSRRGEEDNWIGIHFKHQNVSEKSQLDSITPKITKISSQGRLGHCHGTYHCDGRLFSHFEPIL